MTARQSWTPHGFDEWRQHYPATPFARAGEGLDWTGRYVDCWKRARTDLPRATVVVLVAGLYSEGLPRCHRDAVLALRQAGYSVLRLPMRSSRGVVAQGKHIAATLHKRLRGGERFVALTHSKGGIDMLAALDGAPALRARCDGVALVQPPVGPASIVDDIMGWGATPAPGGPSWKDSVARPLLRTRWVADGTRDISSRRDPSVAEMLARLPRELHCVHAVSWSIERSSRFDAHHARLNARRPGCAHDGQFYLEHQVLAGMPQVCLPHLDHGQPVLGGLGFDAGRFWLALAEVLHAGRPGSQGG
ncbi:hypothetical protein P3W85_13605 [Cupriavidus basilensis]|uniref:Alpha/beta hydrolase n=1 Tax=Cupriavidus basilensis TaxID=68895 RepID=A0ABT6AQF4_9BURK|nr:hypothetical protein [Cupriavidus basilensis]MDF3833981.1 hypothetical protein [Cupriavidus basilensis]